jgi:hypothetical protein
MATGHHSTGNPAKEPRSGPIKVYSGVFCFGGIVPIVSGYMERIAHSFYDTLRLRKGEVFDRFELFQQVAGDVGKEFADTNMTASGQMLCSERFLCRRLWIELLYASAADIEALKSDCTVYLIVRSKTYCRLPASVLVLENTLTRIIQVIKKKKIRPGNPFQDAINSLQLSQLVEPISMEPGVPFSVRVSTSNPFLVDKFAARIFLEGTLYRAIQ